MPQSTANFRAKLFIGNYMPSSNSHTQTTKRRVVLMGFVREIAIETTEREQLVDITDKVQDLVTELNIKDGFVCVYVPHTSAAVSIHREVDVADRPKLDEMLDKINPDPQAPHYTKAALVAPTEVLIVKDGRLVMDPDQRIYFYEFDGPKQRKVVVYVTD
jgi:secondary thiamine-phosphate synthase enzyme